MAIDAQGLQALFSQGNPFLAQMGEDSFNTQTQQQKATLADTVQKTQQDAAMHPIKMATEQALGNNYQASANQSQAMANKHNDELKVLQSVPMDQRVASQMATLQQNISKADMDKLGAEMATAQQYAAKALSQGGKLSLPEITSLQKEHPDLARYFTQPGGANIVANMVTAHNMLDAKRQAEESVAKIHNQGTLGAASIHAKAQLELENQQYQHGKYLKVFNMPVMDKILRTANPRDRNALILGALATASPEDQPVLQGLLDANKSAYNEFLQAQTIAASGKPNAAQLANLPSVPIPQSGTGGPVPGLGPRPANLPARGASVPLNQNGVPDRGRPPLEAFNK